MRASTAGVAHFGTCPCDTPSSTTPALFPISSLNSTSASSAAHSHVDHPHIHRPSRLFSGRHCITAAGVGARFCHNDSPCVPDAEVLKWSMRVSTRRKFFDMSPVLWYQQMRTSWSGCLTYSITRLAMSQQQKKSKRVLQCYVQSRLGIYGPWSRTWCAGECTVRNTPSAYHYTSCATSSWRLPQFSRMLNLRQRTAQQCSCFDQACRCANVHGTQRLSACARTIDCAS